MGYFRFYLHRLDFSLHFTLPYALKKKMFTKYPLNFYSLKVTKFHSDSVKNKSARTKKGVKNEKL